MTTTTEAQRQGRLASQAVAKLIHAQDPEVWERHSIEVIFDKPGNAWYAVMVASAPSTEPVNLPYEWCTTLNAHKCHLSKNLHDDAEDRPGRSGQTLCGYQAIDQELLNAARQLVGQPAPALRKLPECTSCRAGYNRELRNEAEGLA